MESKVLEKMKEIDWTGLMFYCLFMLIGIGVMLDVGLESATILLKIGVGMAMMFVTLSILFNDNLSKKVLNKKLKSNLKN